MHSSILSASFAKLIYIILKIQEIRLSNDNFNCMQRFLMVWGGWSPLRLAKVVFGGVTLSYTTTLLRALARIEQKEF